MKRFVWLNITLRCMQMFLQAAIGLLLARITGAEGNGIVSLFITEASFASVILGMSFESTLIYFTPKYDFSFKEVLNACLKLFVWQLLAATFLYLILTKIIDYHPFKINVNRPSIAWGAVCIFSVICTNYFTGWLNSKGRFNFAAFIGVFFYSIFFLFLLSAAFNIIHYPQQYLTTQFLLPTYTVAFLLVALFIFLFAASFDKGNKRTGTMKSFFTKDMIRYTTAVFIANTVQFCAYRMDIWFVNYYRSKHDVGVYALAAKVSQFWWIAPQFAAGLLFPLIASGRNIPVSKIFRYNLLFAVASALIAVFIYPFAIQLIVKKEFVESYTPFLILLPGVVIFSVNVLMAAHLAGKGLVHVNTQGSVICFIAILLLDILLIPKYGINGAAAASSVGYTICTLYVLYHYLKRKKDAGALAM